eukprot:GHVS01051766.1.p1 GENE.GHVS01051766.1~~GHVS01051766.1.p1  ORF type:complete len:122 (-),score=15.44 GHVS01051766.1:184-549(-)
MSLFGDSGYYGICGCSNYVCGGILLSLSLFILLYYTLWILVTPFLDANTAKYVLTVFPFDRQLGLIVPCYTFMVVLVVVLVFLFHLITTSEQTKEQPQGEDTTNSDSAEAGGGPMVSRKSL